MFSKSTIIALIPLLTTILAQERSFKAYSDPFCTKPLKVVSDGDEVEDGKLHAIKGISHVGGFPGKIYESLEFPDAESQAVYWKTEASRPDNTNVERCANFCFVQDPGRHCGNILMKRTGHGWDRLTPLPGTVLINARREGCFYSGIQVSIA